MFPPAIIAALLEAGEKIVPMTAGISSHLGMLALMLVVMLTHIDAYARPPLRRPRLGKCLRRATAFAAALAISFGVGAVALAGQAATAYSAPPVRTLVASPDPPVHDPAKPTVVVVLGAAGAEVGDVMGPYQTLSATGALNVYTVAARRDPVPLTGGLDLVPDLTFEQLRQRMGPDGEPSAIVVPAMPDAGMPSNQAVLDWLSGQHDRGVTILGVCYGARILADAGLLEGRPATSHWRRLGELGDIHPEVRWQSGTRYVDDGDVLTTGMPYVGSRPTYPGLPLPTGPDQENPDHPIEHRHQADEL